VESRLNSDKLMSMQINIRDISTYRTQLMGVATLMIIACHAPASGVVMPRILSFALNLGNYGVDIFLLLSGLGVYYSLSKCPTRGGGLTTRKDLLEYSFPIL